MALVSSNSELQRSMALLTGRVTTAAAASSRLAVWTLWLSVLPSLFCTCCHYGVVRVCTALYFLLHLDVSSSFPGVAGLHSSPVMSNIRMVRLCSYQPIVIDTQPKHRTGPRTPHTHRSAITVGRGTPHASALPSPRHGHITYSCC